MMSSSQCRRCPSSTKDATLRLRLAPEITFLPDQSIERAARIESLLAQIKSAQPPPPAPDGDADD